MSYPENWEKDISTEKQIRKEDKSYLVDKPKIGEKYHLSWAKEKGMVWILIGIVQNKKCTMMTPKTKKTLVTDISTLRHINRNTK